MNGRILFVVLTAGILPFLFPSLSYAVQEGDIYQCEGKYYKVSKISDTDSYLTYGYDTDGYDRCNQLGVNAKKNYEGNNTCTYRILNVRTEYRNGGPKLYGSCYILYTSISLTKISKPAPPCGENPPDSDNDGVCDQCDVVPGEPDPKDCMPGYTLGPDGNQNGWFIDPGCGGRSSEDQDFYGSNGLRQSNPGGNYIGDDMVSLAEPTKIPPKTCINQSNGTCGCGYAPSTVGPGRATPPYNKDYPDISTLGDGSGGGTGTGGTGGDSGTGGTGGDSGTGGTGGDSGTGGTGGDSGTGGTGGDSGTGGTGGDSGTGGTGGGTGTGGTGGDSGTGGTGTEGGTGSGGSGTEGGSGNGNGNGEGEGEGEGKGDISFSGDAALPSDNEYDATVDNSAIEAEIANRGLSDAIVEYVQEGLPASQFFRDTRVNVRGSNPIVSVPVFGETISIDFSTVSDWLHTAGLVLVFLSTVVAFMIVVKR